MDVESGDQLPVRHIFSFIISPLMTNFGKLTKWLHNNK